MFEKVEFRNDDVLISQNLTPAMVKSLERGLMFEQFKKTDELFKETKTPCILAVLSEGIDEFPEWVEYIKFNISRFKIEMHGLMHVDYRNFNYQQGLNYLALAKQEIERTFDVKISRWYPPFGRKCFPEWGEKVCEELDIKLNKSIQGLPHYPFHFWNLKDVERVKRIMEKYGI